MIILKEKNNESAENYLETILVLSKRLPVVRSVDVANQLDFKKSSVSIAMKNLREKNHITVTDAGYICLTAVSYTHLDVYKRQGLQNLMMYSQKKIRGFLYICGIS